MKRSLTIVCMAALASFCSLSQTLQAEDVPVRNAVYSSTDAVPAVNVSQVVVPAPVAYRPYRAYYRPYYAPYRAYYSPYAYRPYAAPYVAPYVAPYPTYRYGAYYAPYRYYSGYRGRYW